MITVEQFFMEQEVKRVINNEVISYHERYGKTELKEVLQAERFIKQLSFSNSKEAKARIEQYNLNSFNSLMEDYAIEYRVRFDKDDFQGNANFMMGIETELYVMELLEKYETTSQYLNKF